MEVYTLDPLLRREYVIDRFESCIWTERYVDKGDFELVLRSTLENRNLLKAGTKLALNLSHRIMEVESVEDKTDDEGKRILTVTGRSIEKMMEDRVAMGSLADLTTTPKWTLTGTPGVVARKIFHDICVIGILNVQDKIPFINEGTFLFASTIAEPIDPITVEMEPTTVYAAIKNICDVWNLGFRLIREYDTSKLWFDIYTGSDRTTKQNILPPVVFTPELDNLKNATELTTTASAKNVAYVYSPAGFQMVYPQDVDPEIEGFERRVLVVNASDITDENPDVVAALIQRGKEELAQNRTYSAFDGEINTNSQYKPNRDYFLGDLVEVRNSDGVTNDMRVTELIYVSDREGERSYPTLAVNVFINTGSWLSWLANKKWVDMGATEYWADQP
jgi:hypothetical protein